jgi:hypothetical protein
MAHPLLLAAVFKEFRMAKNNKRPSIPTKTKTNLWVLGGGRCYFCNKALWRDDYTMDDMNRAYIAHIIDVNEQTHRYDPVLSPKLEKDISNLMLMCDEHHRMIDREKEADFTVDILQAMKAEHEERIENLTAITKERKSHVLLYGARIGAHDAPLSYGKTIPAIIPKKYPAEPRAIEISLKGSPYQDNQDNYWELERASLNTAFESSVKPRIGNGEVKHISIFALAPQPLLIELGHLISDIPDTDVFQLHREPKTWEWLEGEDLKYEVIEPDCPSDTVALNLSLSGTISNDRITAVLDNDVAIWTVTIPTPNNDFIKSKEHVAAFRVMLRKLMDDIKSKHPAAEAVHVFPACPVSIAVEVGRCRMPKADLPLEVYDENRPSGGFTHALTIE